MCFHNFIDFEQCLERNKIISLNDSEKSFSYIVTFNQILFISLQLRHFWQFLFYLLSQAPQYLQKIVSLNAFVLYELGNNLFLYSNGAFATKLVTDWIEIKLFMFFIMKQVFVNVFNPLYYPFIFNLPMLLLVFFKVLKQIGDFKTSIFILLLILKFLAD